MSGLELTLAVALLASGQDTAITIKQASTGSVTLSLATGNHRPVDEQIEVMRSLLLRKLGSGSSGPQRYSGTPNAYSAGNGLAPFYITTTQQTPANYDAYPLSSTIRERSHDPGVEGTYLDGYGVVFTVTMDATNRDPRPSTDSGTPAPALTEWDREQKRIRGETLPSKSASTAKEPPLGDVLLKLIAENGKHFTALKDDERLTISVTIRGMTQTAPIATLQGTTTVVDPSAAQPSSESPFREDKFATLDLLGQMHLKQGQAEKAIETYNKALTQAEADGPDVLNGAGAERIHGALLKLAQAYIAAGKIDEARVAMDRAKEARAKTAQANKSVVKPAVAQLPARLTISAPKKLLDQVGAGKLSMDDFRKRATVEYTPAGK